MTRMRFSHGGARLVSLAGLATVAPARADTFQFDFENDQEYTATAPVTEPSDTVSPQLDAYVGLPVGSGRPLGLQRAARRVHEHRRQLSGELCPGNGPDIAFAGALDSLSVDFFLDGGATSVNDELLSGGANGTEVASGMAATSIIDSSGTYVFGVEYVLSAGTSSFDTIMFLPDAETGLAIGNLSVTTAVPEPTLRALLLGGLAPLAALRRRRGTPLGLAPFADKPLL